jgi:uncharacterized coiled-coil protein SlyX
MAAIFQIRRGDSSITSSLSEGELYLNTRENALQVGTSTTASIKLLSLNTASFGDIVLSGSAYISGNIVLGGTITIGDSTSDSVVFNADLSSSIIPDADRLYDLGNETNWYRNVYANTISASFISGAIDGIGDMKAFSSSVAGKFLETQYSTSSLNTFSASEESKNSTLALYTASINSKFVEVQSSTASLNVFSASEESKNSTLALYTASIDTKFVEVQSSTASLNTFSGSSLIRLNELETYTASINNKFVEVQSSTASLNTFSGSTLGRLTNLESKSASVDVSLSQIHSYTSSLKTAIDLSGQNVTVLGNLTVNGTTTQINSTQVNIGENILELNFGGSATEAGIYTKDATGASTTSGSLLWDSNLDYWKAGKKDLESKILLAGGDGVLSGSTDFSAFSTSVDSRLSNLQNKSASVDISILNINNETASIESRLATLATYTGSIDTKFVAVGNATSSLNTFSSSTLGRLGELETYTGSINTKFVAVGNSTSSLNVFSASTLIRLGELETTSASVNNSISLLNTFSGSQESKDSTLATYTGSVDTKFTAVQSSTASLNTFSASVLSDLTSIHQTTASLNLFSASINFFSASIFTDFSNSYDAVSESFDYRIKILDPGNIAASIVAINTFTASASSSLHYLNQFTTSADSRLDNLETKSASVDISITNINSTTASLNTSVSNINSTTASLNTSVSNINSFTSSINTTIKTKLDVEGVLSGSIQVLGGTNIVSASTDSNTVDFTITNGNITANLIGGVVSGSTQVLAILSSLNTYTGSNDTLNTTQNGRLTSLENVTGSYETKGRAIHSGSAGDYQFNSIGVNIAASGVAGEIVATGDITAFYSSDIRLKENIQPIPNALEKVNQISGNTYDWKEGHEDIHSHKGNDVGVIAQEIENILPQLVTNRDTGYKAVQYEKLIPLLIEAVKELSAKVDRLEQK